MLTLLWVVPALPLLGFVLLFVSGGRLPKRAVGAIGVGSVGLSALAALAVAQSFLAAPPARHFYVQVLWHWLAIGGLTPEVALRLDPLSLVMVLVVTVVGFLIHLYSAEFMTSDEGYGRFFACMNLFVAAMLVLVLADNLLLLYAGWEGVGLCSYLLIGFWYRDPANGRAARKAFIVTRIGDTAFLVGLLLLLTQLGTLEIAPLMNRAQQAWPVGSPLATAAAALLLGGALGKSAQLPLQTWLPDAMAGPTPVSALIHAATMVTAGVYLIARTHALFELAPDIELSVAVIGAATLLLGASSALCQNDIKRILAYSTMSQIGYMFLALGRGVWAAGIFHFMTHAFFKALLFLAAGAVMMRLDGEHDIFRMGGLWRRLPLAFSSFLAGAASLAAIPLVTAGFYSKEMILWGVWTSGPYGPAFWGAGFLGAILTVLYIFRAVFVVFFGKVQREPAGRSGWRIAMPLGALAVLALVGGFVETPSLVGNVTAFSRFLEPVLPLPREQATPFALQGTVLTATSLAILLTVYLAYLLFLRGVAAPLEVATPLVTVRRSWRAGWGFDALYDRLLVRPFLWLARINRDDVVDALYAALARSSLRGHRAVARTESGRVRQYATWIAAGALAALALVILT